MAGFEVTGRCLCGAIGFSGRVAGPEFSACHCGQCRRWSGYIWAGVAVADLVIAPNDSLRWFRSSDAAERGFCATCGSSLFWRQIGATLTDVAPGALDAPTGLRLAGHIYTADQGDYYPITDGLPQDPRE